MARSKKASKSTPKAEYGHLALLVLIVTTAKGVVDKISTFLPTDSHILDEACAAVEDGSRMYWNCSMKKATVLYKTLGEEQGMVDYGGAAWLSLQAARSDMNSMHAYKAKAGSKARYELRVISKSVTA
jgi:hypothetical protein